MDFRAEFFEFKGALNQRKWRFLERSRRSHFHGRISFLVEVISIAASLFSSRSFPQPRLFSRRIYAYVFLVKVFATYSRIALVVEDFSIAVSLFSFFLFSFLCSLSPLPTKKILENSSEGGDVLSCACTTLAGIIRNVSC